MNLNLKNSKCCAFYIVNTYQLKKKTEYLNEKKY